MSLISYANRESSKQTSINVLNKYNAFVLKTNNEL